MPIEYDIIIRNATIYDGGGTPPFQGDVALRDERIAAVEPLPEARAGVEIDARGLAVAPGFINILSHAQESLIVDGRSQSDIRQGITLEVMGEGRSMGPVNDAVKDDLSFRGGSWDSISSGPPWTATWSTSSAAASRPTSHRSSAQRRCGSTNSDRRIDLPAPRNWTGCATWCGGPWKRARWVSRRR